MSDNIKPNREDEAAVVGTTHPNNRRTFLKLGGTGVAAMALNYVGGASPAMASAHPSLNLQEDGNQEIDLGSGDIGVLNYAYLLEQLEADFYTRVVANFYDGITGEERQILTDIRDHEIIHREFFKAALGENAIPMVQFDFSKVDFSSRESVLVTAQIFEDTGVAAYNGAGQLLESTEYLILAGKIVSVEARHAAAIRDLRIPRSGFFAPDTADPALDPPTILALASPFIRASVSARNLPMITAV